MRAAYATCGAAGNAPVIQILTNVVNGSQAVLTLSGTPTRLAKGFDSSTTLFDAQASYYNTSTGVFLRQDAKILSSFQFVSNNVGVGESIRWTYWYRYRITSTPQWEFYAPLVPRT